MKLHDFECNACHHEFEALIREGDVPPCPDCQHAETTKLLSSFKMFTSIIPEYPGAKRRKAGYEHSHGDRPKTPGKIQVGYDGKSSK